MNMNHFYGRLYIDFRLSTQCIITTKAYSKKSKPAKKLKKKNLKHTTSFIFSYGSVIYNTNQFRFTHKSLISVVNLSVFLYLLYKYTYKVAIRQVLETLNQTLELFSIPQTFLLQPMHFWSRYLKYKNLVNSPLSGYIFTGYRLTKFGIDGLRGKTIYTFYINVFIFISQPLFCFKSSKL